MTLGEKIQQLRKAAGISQEQLAEQLDVSRQSISKWELNDAVPEISKIIMNAANKQVNLGFKTIVAGLILLVLEFMFLPVFGTLQKAHVNQHGFYLDFIQYAAMQPMPIIFGITIAVIVVGVAFLSFGLYSKKHNTAK